MKKGNMIVILGTVLLALAAFGVANRIVPTPKAGHSDLSVSSPFPANVLCGKTNPIILDTVKGIDYSIKKDTDFWIPDEVVDAKFERLLQNYTWYKVDGLFPFTALTGSGLECGKAIWNEKENSFQYDAAYEFAQTYYSLATVYDAPDGILHEIYQSNYPQFNSSTLHDYRWFWDTKWLTESNFSPKQPQGYSDPIVIQAAVMNWTFLDSLNDNNLSLSLLTEQQNDWINQNRQSEPNEQGPFYQLTGLCVLNGDSRTEESFFNGSRAKDIRIIVNGDYCIETRLDDTPIPQTIDLYYTQDNIAVPLEIQIECLSSYGGEIADIYITEIGIGLNSSLLAYGH